MRLQELTRSPRTCKPLTPTQTEILSQIMEGRTNKEIACLRKRSPKTIQRHTEDLYRRLQVNSAVCAVVKGLRLGIIKL